MNLALLKEMLDRAFASTITFPEILGALGSGESFATPVSFPHGAVAPTFSADALHAINLRVQAGAASFADFVRESTDAGCAYYVVYLNGKKVRYFGRDGGEHIQHFPRSD